MRAALAIQVLSVTRRAVCVAISYWWIVSPSVQAQQQQLPLQALMKEARTLAEDYAAVVRARFSKSSAQYKDAETLYVRARAKFAGVIQAMKLAIEDGELKTLEANKPLTRAATEAQEAARKYFDHVDNILSRPQSKGVAAAVAVLSSIVAVVTEVISSVDKGAKTIAEMRKERAEKARRVEDDLSWKAWDDVLAK